MKVGRLVFLIVLAGLAVACALPSPQAREQANASGAPAPPKVLTITLEGEPRDAFVTSLNGGSARIASDLKGAVHHQLAMYGEAGEPKPQLAAELPDRTAGTWTVRPDGTMQTIYRLRHGVTWHDGAPLTAADFRLGWVATRDPDLPMADRGIALLVSEIDTPDPFTLVIEWAQPYPFANAVIQDDFGPLPAHLLEGIYMESKDRFTQLPYWTREFVGTGPYILSDWEAGSHFVLRAYDGFYGGRAHIDTIIVRFLTSSDTVAANLLAGSIDGVISGLSFNQTMFVKREWEAAGRKPVVVLQSTHWNLLGVQFRDPQPRDILDVRVRRGLLHALDRQAMVDTLFEGLASVSHAFIHPTDARWEWVKDVIVRYDYDPRQAQELLTAAGWGRGSDGTYVDARGDRFAVPLWTTGSETAEQQLAIIGDYWKAVGVPVDQVVLGQAQTRDNRLRASFPAFDITSIPLNFQNTMRRVYGPTCPTEASRWSGGNRGCYQNLEADRLVDALNVAIDPAEQRRLTRDFIRFHTEELPVMPLNYSVNATTFREGLIGVKGDTQPRTSKTWNIAEWDMRS
jgi:peptide/nickel transport system substrate-binding protein